MAKRPDANDILRSQGHEGVRRAIAEAEVVAVEDAPSSDKTGPSGDVHGKKARNRRLLLPATEMTSRPHDWLWKHYLARGELHLIAGSPGVGKTTLALKIVATVTRGELWPDGERAPAGYCIIWSGEDQIETTLRPRLQAMNADLSRVLFVGMAVDPDTQRERFFDPASDLNQLRRAIIDELDGEVALILLDPISATIVGDSHKNAEVRRSFLPVQALAADFNCAVLGITHFAKASEKRDAVERVLGSVAFTAGPRMVLVAIRPHDESQPFRLVRAKTNISPPGGGFEYQLVQWLLPQPDGAIPTQYVQFGKVLEGPARTLLAVELPPKTERPEPALDEAKEFLAKLLAGGSALVREIEHATKEAGHSWATVRRAKAALGARSVKDKESKGKWRWTLSVVAAHDEPADA